MSDLSVREKEIRRYWRVMQAAPADMSVSEFQFEMEMLGRMTASPVVKDLCARNLHRFDGPYNVLRAVAST